MRKCRLIDMEAYSRGVIQFLDGSKPPQNNHYEHADVCPVCGRNTLRHIEGCVRCYVCGYDACAMRGGD